MREFKKINQVFIKSNNTINKIFNRYLYCLIPFILLLITYNLIWGEISIIINLIKSLILSLVTCITTQIVFNITKKEELTKNIFENNLITISIILGLFSINSSIITIIISSIISIIIKNIYKNITISSSLYGILIILISNHYINNIDTPLLNLANNSYKGTYNDILTSYGTIKEYIIGSINYLSPILSISIFLYLFYKKSIKYDIVFSYITTFTLIMLFIGLFNNMNIWYVFFHLTTGNILFLSIFCLPDYPVTPTTREGQTIYGIILGTITSVLRFIIPELSVVLTLILGPIILTKQLNKISYKLKYQKNYYSKAIITIIILTITTTLIITKLI